MTAKSVKERAEGSRQPRAQCEVERAPLQWAPGAADASRIESERPAAPQSEAAEGTSLSPACTSGLGLKEVSRRTARAVESVIIKYVLEEVRGNRVEAARRLQISYKALLYKIEMYQLGDSGPARRLPAPLGPPRSEPRPASRNEIA